MGRVLHAFYILCILFSHLTHEVWYDPMEDGVLQSETFLSSAQSPEVLCSLGNNMWEQLNGDVAQWFIISGHFEEHQRVSVFGVLLDSGHVWHWGRRSVVTGLLEAILTFTEGLLKRLCYLGCFELGCQLLHHTFTVWGKKKKKIEQNFSLEDSSRIPMNCL